MFFYVAKQFPKKYISGNHNSKGTEMFDKFDFMHHSDARSGAAAMAMFERNNAAKATSLLLRETHLTSARRFQKLAAIHHAHAARIRAGLIDQKGGA